MPVFCTYSLADSRDASASKNFMMLNVGPTLLVVEELFHSAFQVLTGGVCKFPNVFDYSVIFLGSLKMGIQAAEAWSFCIRAITPLEGRLSETAARREKILFIDSFKLSRATHG